MAKKTYEELKSLYVAVKMAHDVSAGHSLTLKRRNDSLEIMVGQFIENEERVRTHLLLGSKYYKEGLKGKMMAELRKALDVVK